MSKEAKEYHDKWIHDKKDLRDRFEVMEGYAQSQLKERDELIIELWDLWQSFAEAGMLEINRNFIDSYPKFQKQIEDFNLKTQNKEDETG